MGLPTLQNDRVRMDDYQFQRAVDGVRDSFPLSSVVGQSVKLLRAGNELKACCPFHADRTPSFTIYKGDRRWHCFGCGLGGDVIDFVRQAEGVGVIEAIRLLDAGAIPVIEPKVAAWSEEADRTDEALAIWEAAQPIRGTAAEFYLRRRAITIDLPDTLRFARIPLGKRPIMPALVALVVNAVGAPCGIQRTYLTEDGSKAPLPDGKVKFSLGRVRGGAIRLGPVGAELAICEGLEDGLSLVQLGAPAVFVAAGAGMMSRISLPSCVSDLVIGGDADDAGRRAAREAAEAFAEQGRRVRVIYAAFVTSADAGDAPEVLVPPKALMDMTDREVDVFSAVVEPGPHALLLTGNDGEQVIYDLSDGYAACLSRIKEELGDAA